MNPALLATLLADRAERRPAALLTWLVDGRQQLAHRAEDLGADAELGRAVDQALRSDRAVQHQSDAGAVFVHPYNPPLRLVIVGAVHIAQHLSRLAAGLGYAVTVVDPRTAFASEARFPATALSHDWPDRALDRHGLDSRCALVTLSHDPKLDDPALESGLRSACFYIGALGSLRTQERRRERLRAQGFAETELSRIHGPVGLDIGARSPSEIAVSIAAEMTECLRRPGT